ncbi:MAG: protein kinase domain-containing protein [Planctomycetota bacterium]
MSADVRDPHDFFFGEVLRISPGIREPDHYTLLGLAFFERDEETIRSAGRERKAWIRAVPEGTAEFEHVRQEMLERVREARRTLLTPAAVEAYDAFLIGNSGAGAPPPEEPDFALEDGAEFANRFRILKEERRGAFGRVYAALDSREGRRVELTVLPPLPSHDPQRRRRAERAVRRLNELDHRRVVRATAVGEAEGLLYAAWPAPEGISVLRHVQRQPHGRLDPASAAEIADKVAAALAHAHTRGHIHGDLHPRNIHLEPEGGVRLTEFGLAVGAQPPKQLPRSPYTAPERELTAAADRYSLGAVAYFMLSGEAPFLDGGRALVPAVLPDDVSMSLATNVLGLLGREPDHRIAKPKFVSAPARAPRQFRRLPAFAAVGLILVVVVVAFALSRTYEPEDAASRTPAGRAWKLIGDRQFDAAIRLIESEGERTPEDTTLRAPLASALEGAAHAREKDGDWYGAQRLLERAELTEHEAGRARQLERVRTETRRLLDAVSVTAAGVARDPVVTVEFGDAQVKRVVVGGVERTAGGRVPLTLDEGVHSVDFLLEDAAGNRREGSIRVAVDRTPPELEVLDPLDGAMLRDGTLRVRVQVTDANPPASIGIHGRRAALEGGSAALGLSLPNGRHEIAIEVTDLAGNRVAKTIAVTVDDSAPSIVMESMRYVTRKQKLEIRGQLAGTGARLEVDGQRVKLERNGNFVYPVDIEESGTITFVATGGTGVVTKAPVEIIVDDDAPAVEFDWKRRDRKGRLLYGSREMDSGTVVVPIRAKDATKLRFFPSEGAVMDGAWRLPPHQGEREVTLRAVDEAGNESTIRLGLAGHRAAPKLTVESSVGEVTRENRVWLQIESDKSLFLNGKPIEAGRVEMPLPEGEVELNVKAVDPYGNETVWQRTVRVDRTPPRLKVVGPLERGVGRQKVTIEADEDLASITCLSSTREKPGRTATFEDFLEVGRTHLHVVARDLAGNVKKAKLELKVVNRVLMLDGKSAALVRLPPTLTEFTVEFWARGAPAVDPAVLVSRGVERAYQVVWSSSDEALPHVMLDLEKTGLTTIVAKKLREPTAWHHYALVHDGKKLRFFLDGRQQGYLEAKESLTRGTGHLLIGAGNLGEERVVESGFIGRIDELRISDGARYSRAFSPSRFLRADAKTRLMLRFDTTAKKKFPDSSKSNVPAEIVGKARLAKDDN